MGREDPAGGIKSQVSWPKLSQLQVYVDEKALCSCNGLTAARR
jgi:hypothetical protein